MLPVTPSLPSSPMPHHTDAHMVTGYTLQELILMGERFQKALDLIHEIDTCRLLALVGRLDPHDAIAMAEAVDMYNLATKRVRSFQDG